MDDKERREAQRRGTPVRKGPDRRVEDIEIDHENRRTGKDRRRKERRSGAERRLANQG